MQTMYFVPRKQGKRIILSNFNQEKKFLNLKINVQLKWCRGKSTSPCEEIGEDCFPISTNPSRFLPFSRIHVHTTFSHESHYRHGEKTIVLKYYIYKFYQYRISTDDKIWKGSLIYLKKILKNGLNKHNIIKIDWNLWLSVSVSALMCVILILQFCICLCVRARVCVNLKC